MDQSIHQQDSEANHTVTNSKPMVKLAQSVSEWAKYFFTLTEEEKVAAGISDYKNYRT